MVQASTTIRGSLVLVCVALGVGTGCESIFRLDKYSTAQEESAPAAPPPDAAVPDRSTDTATDACASASTSNLETTCTNAACVPFDNALRIRGFAVDAAVPAIAEAGAVASGVDAQAQSDAAPGDSGGAGPDAGSSPALPLCSSLPQPVYMIGSSGLAAMAAELGALVSTVPITIVFTTAHSCDGAKAIILDETSFATGAVTASYWDVSGTAHACQLDDASQYADIGLSIVFAEDCISLPQGAQGVGDFLGPVVPGAMVVPTSSTQAAISAEALYYIFGVANGDVAPWTDPGFLFVNSNSGVQLDFGLDIGVPAGQWRGSPITTTTQNITEISTSNQPEKTLGTMSTDLVESAATSSAVKELAFRDYGQDCAYYPNSTATSFDKQNVRDGHYPIWGFTHMFTKVNAQSVPLNPNAAAVIAYFTGVQPTPTGDFLKYIVNEHIVPVCAMRVTRSSEMGPLMPFEPSPSCGCYFDSLTTGHSSCTVCSVAADCPSSAPRCNLGYCEAH
jgi:hypothetical protein